MDRQPSYEELEQRIRVLEAECAKGKEAEARYRNLFENLPEEIHVWRLVRDAQGQIQTWELVDANPPALRTWSTTLADIQGKRPDDIFGPGVTAHFMPVVQKIMAEGKPCSYEDYVAPLAKHFRFTSFPFGSDQFVTNGADITERERTERALQDNAALYRAILDSRHVVKLLVEPDTGRIVDANRAAADFYGYSQEELRYLRAWDFSTRTREELLPLLSAIATGQIAAPLPHSRHRLRSGELRDVTVYADLLQREEGVLILATVIDATEAKRAEQALQESEARLQRVLDGTNDGFWEWNVVTGETLFSGHWAEMLGYDPAEIEPHVRSWERLVHPADLPHAWAAVQAHFSGATPQYQNEHRLRAKNGEWRWILDRGKVSARDAEGRPLRMSGTHADVTERKAAELALRAAQRDLLAQQDHLEEQVARRTAELASALDAAEAAGRAKSAFLANVSHEIHTPLNAILGFAHLLRRRAADPDQSAKLDKIAAASNQLLALLDGVLDLARLDAGRLVLERIAFAPETVARETVDRLRPQAEAKRLDLRLELDSGLARYPVLYGDPNRLGQLLVNYLDNAIKFSERGAVALRGRALEERAGGVLLRFEVQDEGPGIASDALPRLFATFEQADQSATRRHGGAGLGLALNRRLARLMGGEVGVESILGAGSTFWCTVRFETQPPAAA